MARLTPAQRHFARKMAAKASVAKAAAPSEAEAAARAGASEYELKRAELGEDLAALKRIQSIDNKILLKRDLIGKYDDWVAGVLDAHAGGARAVQDDILLQMMIWALDIADYDRALPLVEYVLNNELALPERFTRTAQTLIAEISADAALAALQQGEDCNLTWLQLVEQMTGDLDMIDQVRAKLHKAIGIAIGRAVDKQIEDGNGAGGSARSGVAEALGHLRIALRHHEKSGVKKEIERLERLDRKLAEKPAGGKD